jgi:hypothetical protein
MSKKPIVGRKLSVFLILPTRMEISSDPNICTQLAVGSWQLAVELARAPAAAPSRPCRFIA